MFRSFVLQPMVSLLFRQVLNLFRSRGGGLVVDLGYNRRAVASCARLATQFMTDFEVGGEEGFGEGEGGGRREKEGGRRAAPRRLPGWVQGRGDGGRGWGRAAVGRC